MISSKNDGKKIFSRKALGVLTNYMTYIDECDKLVIHFGINKNNNKFCILKIR